MTIEENIFRTIKARSKFIIRNENKWKKEISSAKNYVTTNDLKDWTFAKSAGLNNGYHDHGGAAKKWLCTNGFFDILKLPASNYKNQVVKSFLAWATKVRSFDIIAKYERDQKKNRHFEILVHSSILPKIILHKVSVSFSNQKYFDEGFRGQIVREIAKRNATIKEQAKLKYGEKCKVCLFSFSEKYGSHGLGFIEMHHLYPIANGQRKTRKEDLRPVCANCHRMLHRGNRLLTIKELKEIIEKAKRRI